MIEPAMAACEGMVLWKGSEGCVVWQLRLLLLF